jgi:hypothetical protein
MPGKRSSFTLPVEPISPPPKPAAAAPWIVSSVTGLGGGAGYRPRVRRAYFDAVYRHSRAGRRFEYRHYGAFFKAENQIAIRPAAFMEIRGRREGPAPAGTFDLLHNRHATLSSML